MGITRSKLKASAREKRTKGKRTKGRSKTPDIPSSQVDDYEDVELILLRKSIKKDPQNFILNNLMMCVQFFENYEE